MNKTNNKIDNFYNLTKDELINMVNHLSNQVNDLKTKLNWYEEQVIAAKKDKFDSKSDKPLASQLSLFNEVEYLVDNDIVEEVLNDEPKTKVKRKKKLKLINIEDVTPNKTIHHIIENNECEYCGNKNG